MRRTNREREELRCVMQAFMAVAALGGRFHDGRGAIFGEPSRRCDLFAHTRDYAKELRDAVCSEYAEAVRVGAYFVEPVWIGGDGRKRERYGYRLCRYSKDGRGGHQYSGEVFETTENFWRAMRTLQDVGGKLGGCAE